MDNKILDKVNEYYSKKIIENGISSKGVDWNSHESHYLRFEQLTKHFNLSVPFTLLDYGCGYGALIDYLAENKVSNFNYVGFDVSDEMIKVANQKYQSEKFLFTTNIDKEDCFDFVLANGIFNVRLDESNEAWQAYVLETLNQINRLSKRGFSFNILTKYSDKEFMRDYLYYADPLFFFDYCKTQFSMNVSLIHDYPLYEFSIIVKK